MELQIRNIIDDIEKPLTYEYPIGIDEDGYNELIKKLNNLVSVKKDELIKSLKGIIQCCDGNNPDHEQIYYIAKDALDTYNNINN